MNLEGQNEGWILGAAQTQLCAASGLPFNGQLYVPNENVAFLSMKVAFGFPHLNLYGAAAHPAVIAAHFQTLRFSILNYRHQMRAHGRPHDRIIGFIADCLFPDPKQDSVWRVQADPKKAPFGTAVAALFKLADGVDKILPKAGGQDVSQEVTYDYAQSGFAVQMFEGDARWDDTPDDMAEAGWNYVPLATAPKEIRATWKVNEGGADMGRSRRPGAPGMIGLWNSREVAFLYGGLAGKLDYRGVGLVEQGAETEAEVVKLLAEFTGETGEEFDTEAFAAGLRALSSAFGSAKK